MNVHIKQSHLVPLCSQAHGRIDGNRTFPDAALTRENNDCFPDSVQGPGKIIVFRHRGFTLAAIGRTA